MKPHPFDPVSFAFGLLFLAIGVALVTGEFDLADLSGRGIVVLPVLFLGVLFVAIGIRRVLGDRAGTNDDPEATAEPTEDLPTDR
jgi:hypothetical protein